MATGSTGVEGLLAGIAGGLSGGVQGYQQALERKRQNRKDAFEELIAQAPLLEQGKKIEEDKNGGLILTDTGGEGSLKKRLQTAQLQQAENELTMAPLKQQEVLARLNAMPAEARARDQSMKAAQLQYMANQKAYKDSLKPTTDTDVVTKLAGRDRTAYNSRTEASAALKDMVDALNSGQSVTRLPLTGDNSYSSAKKRLESSLRAARMGEHGEPGAFDSSELPTSTDSPEIVKSKLEKLAHENQQALAGYGLTNHPAFKEDYTVHPEKMGATPGTVISGLIGKAGGLLGLGNTQQPTGQPAVAATAEPAHQAPVGEIRTKGGIQYHKTSKGWVPLGN